MSHTQTAIAASLFSSADQKLRVLMIEDSPGDVFLTRNMLENTIDEIGFEVRDVPRLVDAFALIESTDFDVVMLDLNLLDIDGVAAVKALHAQIPFTPIIVYSGSDDKKLYEKALLCGAQHYLIKGQESARSLKHLIRNATGYYTN
jgi:two-component system KDP operon response regulator KdpE